MSTTPTLPPLLFFGPLCLVVVLSLLVASQGYLELTLDSFEATQLGRLFLIVIFAAAAIERAVEVYVNMSLVRRAHVSAVTSRLPNTVLMSLTTP